MDWSAKLRPSLWPRNGDLAYRNRTKFMFLNGVKCKTLYCTQCWVQIEVRKSSSSSGETFRGKCASPVAVSPPALNADMHVFSLTVMAWNDVLFQV